MIASIAVTDFEGNKVDLITKYKGLPLLLIFYNNACLGCTGRAIPLAYEFQQENPSIQVIGIHSNFGNAEVTKEDIQSIFTSGEVPFPIYIDKNHSVYDQFDAEGTPQWILITSEGELYKSIFGSQDGAQNRLSYAIEALINGDDIS
ncbi:MAG TPA: redoxin domain-containing protein [Prolixibacteraceae bacterium]|nr:redoxin domain-containing protein [Prolixibacteraceae bacterium]